MSNIKKVQCSKCGKWVIPGEEVHSLYNSGECHVTCLDCAPSGRTISPDEIKGGRETLENISKLFGNLNMTQHERRFNFGPASPKEKIVFGAERPGYDSKRVALTKVHEWIAFIKEHDIKRICCLLSENHLNYYDGIDLINLYIKEFGKENICSADIEDFHLCDEHKLKEIILPFLQESDRKKEKVVVHCSGGSGRTGHVLAAWLVHRHGLFPYEALLTVKKMEGVYRNPCEAVGKNATKEELYALLEACKCSKKEDLTAVTDSDHMLIGLISDVHSNAVALKAVLEEFDKLGVKIILHAGDIVGYNPYPDETIELFKKKKIVSILGNHDRAFMTGDTSYLNSHASEALEWTRNTASRDSLNYIKRLKDKLTIDANGELVVLFHESPKNFPEYIFPENVTPDLLSNINGDILVLGHTHKPFIMDYGTRGLVVNPGSVGQPRDGNPDASFAVLDTVTQEIQLKRTKYDIEKVIEDMLTAHLPEALAYRLRAGH